MVRNFLKLQLVPPQITDNDEDAVIDEEEEAIIDDEEDEEEDPDTDDEEEEPSDAVGPPAMEEQPPQPPRTRLRSWRGPGRRGGAAELTRVMAQGFGPNPTARACRSDDDGCRSARASHTSTRDDDGAFATRSRRAP